MGKASSAKKVARAARTGGGRTARGRGSWLWPSVLAVTVVLGTAGVVVSRGENEASAETHLHAAYGISICGTFQPDLPQPSVLLELHTHSDGVIHVEPGVGPAATNSPRQSMGDKATVGLWASGQPGLKVAKDSITLPDGKTYKNGDKCGDKAGEVQTVVNGERRTGDPNKIVVKQDQKITFAFAPKGERVSAPPRADEKIEVANTGQTERPSAPTTLPGTPSTAPGAPAAAPGTPPLDGTAPTPVAPPTEAPPPAP